MPSNKRQRLLLDWTRKIHTLEYAHRYASMAKERLNLWLGIPAVITSAAIGAQVSTPWQQEQVTQVLVAVGGIVVAILVGLQTFLKPSEMAEKHRSASAVYEDLRHRLELLLTKDDVSKLEQELNLFKAEWDRLETPNVSDKSWHKAKNRVSELGTYPASFQLPENSTMPEGLSPTPDMLEEPDERDVEQLSE
jgi:hypothetical protein